MITCLGDLFLDVHVRRTEGPGGPTTVPLAATLGGAAANTASWLAQSGTPSGVVGSVGADFMGTALLADLRRRGVRAAISRVAGMTSGICMVVHEQSGAVEATASRAANDELRLDSRQRRLLLASSWLHVSAYAFFAEASRALILQAIDLARANGATVSLDLGAPHLVRHVGPVAYARLLRTANPRVLFANELEAALLAGPDDPLDALASLAEIVMLKRGAAGCIVYDGRSRMAIDAVPAEEIDPTGAGDAFAAGAIACLSADGSPVEAARAGAMLGAACVAVMGGRPPQHRHVEAEAGRVEAGKDLHQAPGRRGQVPQATPADIPGRRDGDV
jgi:sugar/nucleoside kinase (ribokinase family)